VQPSGTETRYEAAVVLERRRWRFAFFTNTTDDAWYFDLRADDGSPLVLGLGLSLGVDLLAPYRHLDVPPGFLFVVDQGLGGRDPDVAAFAEQRAALLYLDSEGSP